MMLEISQRSETIVLDGDLTPENRAALERDLPPLLRRATICDCMDLEVEGGVEMAALVNLLLQRARESELVVRGAPQMLAHNLYRTHGLERGIVLEDVRFDESSVQ